MINWWLDKGIDGFRVDAISHIKKEPGLKDMPNPNNERYVSSFDKHMNVEGVQDFLKELKENTFDKYDIMTVGEANGVSTEDAEEWVGEENGKFSMVFQFEHLDLWNNANNEKFNAKQCKEVLSNWQIALEEKGWNALFIENHDITRVVSSWGNDKDYWRESSKALGLMYFMQKGTPFIYQGQEIGMTNVKFKSIDEYNDVKGINYFKENIENGMSEDEALRIIRATSRDNTRTPMQWNSTKNAGFTYGTPWIGVTDNYKNINVEIELNDDDSILNFYKKMIKLKKERLPLIYGKYNLILEEDEDIYAYERILDNDRYIIITNLSENNVIYSYKNAVLNSDNLLLSNYQVKEHKDSTEFDLRPYEARLYKVK